jgi:hypothetical protein
MCTEILSVTPLIEPARCYGDTTWVGVIPAGGALPYTYSWSGSASTNSTFRRRGGREKEGEGGKKGEEGRRREKEGEGGRRKERERKGEKGKEGGNSREGERAREGKRNGSSSNVLFFM